MKDPLICEKCGFKAVSRAGLAGHMRLAHLAPTKKTDLEATFASDAFDEAITEAINSALEVQNEYIDERFEDFAKQCRSVFEVLKQNDLDVIEGIKKRDEVLKKLDEVIMIVHVELHNLAKKLGVKPEEIKASPCQLEPHPLNIRCVGSEPHPLNIRCVGSEVVHH